MKKKTFKIQSWLLTSVIVFSSIFGVFKSNETIVEAKTDDTVTVPGGISTSGVEYADYTYDEDSPTTDGYAQAPTFSPSAINPVASYVQVDNNPAHIDAGFIEDADGTLYSSIYNRAGSPFDVKALRVDSDMKVTNLGYYPGSNINQYPVGIDDKYVWYGQARGEVVALDKSNVGLAKGVPSKRFTPSLKEPFIYFSPMNGKTNTYRTVGSVESPNKYSQFGTYDFPTATLSELFRVSFQDNGACSACKSCVVPSARDYVKLNNGLMLVNVTKEDPINHKMCSSLVLFNPEKSGTDANSTLVHAYGLINPNLTDNMVIMPYLLNDGRAVTYDRNNQTFYYHNPETGMIDSEVSFSKEDLVVGQFFDASIFEGIPPEVEVGIVGTASPTGRFAGYGKTSGMVIAFFDKEMNPISAAFTGEHIDPTTNVIRRVQISENKKLIFVSGVAKENNHNLFKNYFDYNIEADKTDSVFLGRFEYTHDRAPKILQPINWNIKLDGEMNPSEIDNAMLSYIKKDMSGENNSYDDHTSNAVLYDRINKNIYDPDYEEKNIDWELFGLTRTSNPKNEKETYKAGPYDVTYGVSDMALNESVTSGLVNIVEQNTTTDNDENVEDATLGLHAKSYRVKKGTENLTSDEFILNEEHADAFGWNLITGEMDAADKVKVLDKSKLVDEIGVYPVVVQSTQSSLTKQIYVTVYDDTMVSGPEDPANTDPANLKNSEVLSAVDNAISVFEATESYESDAKKIASAKAWYTEREPSEITPVTVLSFKQIADENGEIAPIDVSHTNGVFTPKEGKYEVLFGSRTSENGGGAQKKVIITLTKNISPVLTADTFVKLTRNGAIPSREEMFHLAHVSITNDQSVTLKDIETTSRNGRFNGNPTSDDIDTSIDGVYTIKYSVTNKAGETAEAYTHFVVGGEILDDKYVVFAKDFDVHVDEVVSTPIETRDEQIISKSNAKAQDLTVEAAPSIIPTIKDAGGYTNVVGPYEIKFVVNGSIATKNIIANVYKYASNEDLLKKFIIDMKPVVEMTVTQAREYLSSGKTVIDAPFLDVHAWEKNTINLIALKDGVHYKTPKELQNASAVVVGDYPITVTVGNGTDEVSKKGIIKIIAEGQPQLIVDPIIVKVPLNTKVSDITTDLMTGVTARDGVNGKPIPSISTQLIAYNGVTSATAISDLTFIDTSKDGIYKIEYKLVDSQGIEKTAIRYYVVGNDPVINDEKKLVLFADSYQINTVDEGVKKGDYTNQPIEKSRAALYNLDTTELINQKVVVNKDNNPKKYADRSMYTFTIAGDSTLYHAVGPYPLELKSTYKGTTLSKNITASVVGPDTIVGNKIAIDQHDATLRRSAVAGRNAATITELQVWNLESGEIYKDYELDDDTFGTYTDLERPIKDYAISVSKTLDGKTVSSKKTISIVTGDFPVIEYTDKVDQNGVVEFTLDAAKTLDVTKLPHIKGAWDTEDTGGKGSLYADNRVKLENDGDIDVAKSGVYHVIYSVFDNDKNKSTKVVTYVIGSKGVSNIDTIFADNITVKKNDLSKVTNMEEFVQTASHVMGQTFIKDEQGIVVGTNPIELSNIKTDYGNLTSDATIGAYPVTFTTPGNATARIVVNVIDDDVSTAGDVYIYAVDATRRPSKVTLSDTAPVLTKVRAWNSITGEVIDFSNGLKVTTTFEPDNVKTPMDEQTTKYPVGYTVEHDTKSGKDVTITIDNGEKPVIKVTKTPIHLRVNETAPVVDANATATDVEDDAEGLPLAVLALPTTVNTSKKGITVVTYNAVDSDGNKAVEQTASYVVGSRDPKPGDEVSIFADDFAVSKADFDAAINKDQLILGSAHAFAKMIADGSDVAVTVKDATAFKKGEVGPHEITLQAGNKTITIIGSIYKDGGVVDDVIIEAKDRTIRLGDVPDTPTLEDAYDILNIDPNDTTYHIQSWKLDGTPLVATATDSQPTFKKEVGTYAITLTAGGKSIVRNIKIVKADGPILKVLPTTVKVPLGSTITIDDVMQGVTINHVDSESLLTELKTTMTPQVGTINTKKEGLYVVTYQVTDKDGNVSNTELRNYIVGDAVDNDDAAVFGHGYTLEVKDVRGVDENGVQEPKLSDILVDLTDAKGFGKTAGTIPGIGEAPSLKMRAVSSTYKKAVGGYPIELSINDPEFTGVSPVRNVIANIIDNDNGSGEVGEKYAVQGFNATYRPSIANGQSLVDLTHAIGWNVQTAESEIVTATAKLEGTEQLITDGEWLTSWPADGTYEVTLTAGTGLDSVSTIVTLIIDKGDAPAVTFNPAIVEVDLGGTKPDVKNGVTVTDDHDTLTVDDLQITPTDIATDEKGVTIVTYVVEDSDKNTTVVTRPYIVRDPIEDGVGDTYVIFATNFTKHVKDVDTENSVVVADAKVKVQEIATGDVIPQENILDVVKIKQGGYKAVAGKYPMTFTVTKDRGAKANIIASVIDDDVPMPPITDRVVINGNNYTGRPDSAKGIALKELTNAMAWDRKTGDDYTNKVTVDFDGDGYNIDHPVQGNYGANITLDKTVKLPHTDVARTIDLISGNKPVISFAADTEIIELDVFASVDVYNDVIAEDEEDGKFTNGAVGTLPADQIADRLYADVNVDTTQEGVQKVTYTAFDVDGNVADSKVRYYLIGSKGHDSKYAIFAKDFHEKVEQMTTNDADIIEKAKGYAIEIATNKKVGVIIPIDGAKAYKLEAEKEVVDRLAGPYPITMQVASDTSSLRTTVTANETKYTRPDPNTNYYIDAKDVTILKSHVGMQKAQELTEVVAWNAVTGLPIKLDAENVDGEKLVKREKPAFVAEVGVYKITYDVVKSGKSVKNLAVTITVISGDAPLLEVNPPVVSLAKGDDLSKVDFFYGVTGTDVQDGTYPNGTYNSTSKEKQKIYADGKVDSSLAGTYVVSYNVTDSDDNMAETQYRSYVVDGAFGENYAIFGHDFAINVTDVDVTNRETQILAQSEAKVELLVEPATRGTAIVSSDGGYTNAVGPYEIELAVKEEPTTVRSIIASVHEGIASDHDIMSAHDGKVRPSQINKDTVEKVTGSMAWNKTTGLPVEYAWVVRNSEGEEVSFDHSLPLGTYTVTFITTEFGTTLTRKIEVIPGEAPVITLDPQVVEVTGPVDLLDGVTANDAEDTGTANYPTSRIKVDGIIDTEKTGRYEITYTVTDDDKNTVTAKRIYLVNPSSWNTEAVLFAHDFQIKEVDVATTDVSKKVQITEKSKAHAYATISGDELPIIVNDLGGYTNVAAVYVAKLEVKGFEEVTTNVSIEVLDTIAPDAPIIDPIEAGENPVISGTAEPNTTVDVTLPDGTVIGDVPVGEEGHWTTTSPTPLQEGDKVIAVSKDPAGNISEPGEQTVHDTIAPDAPIIDPIEAGENPVISGTAEPNTTVDVTLPDGTVIEDVPVDEEGHWTTTSPTPLQEGDKVIAVSKDPAGNISEPAQTTVLGREKEVTYEITAHDITIDINDFRSIKASKQLDNYIEKEANVQVHEIPTGSIYPPTSIDTTVFDHEEVQSGNTYQVVAVFVPNRNEKKTRMNTNLQDTDGDEKVEKQIGITITNKLQPKVQLPTTGDPVVEVISVSSILLGLGIFIIYRCRKKTIKKN